MTQLKTLIAWLYSLVGRFNRWLARSPLFAYLVLVLAIAFGFNKIENTQEQTEKDRAERIQVVAQIIGDICKSQNQQDAILGALVGVSLQIPPDRELTQRQENIIAIFQQAYDSLVETPNCKDIIHAYLTGTYPPPVRLFDPDEGGIQMLLPPVDGTKP